MKKQFAIIIILSLAVLIGFFVYEKRIDRRPLKVRMIEEEKRWLSYNHSEERREFIKNIIQRLEKMDQIDPPFIIQRAEFSVLEKSDGEYMGWGIGFSEDGFVTKGIRLRDDSQLSSRIIKEIPFPEDIWDYDIHNELKNCFARTFHFEVIPGQETKWIQSNLLSTSFPSEFFENSIYISLYDSQGRECEPILCEEN